MSSRKWENNMGDELAGALKEQFYDLPIELCCIINLNTFQVTHANASFEHILGWNPSEITGKPLTEFVHTDEDKAVIEKAFSKIKLGVHSLTFETEFHCKNTQVRWISWKCYIDAENQCLFAVGHDITSHKEAQKILASQSHIDQLTGTFDRQTFVAVLQKELGDAALFHVNMAIILIDIDHFRTYNRQNGLSQGDVCLRHVAMTLKTCLRRKTDFLARFENDTFAVLLSHNNLEKAAKSAEYLRANLEAMADKNTSADGSHPITVSLGVAAISEIMEKTISPDQILTAAAHALEASRQLGGNQVSCAEEFR